MLFVWHCRVLLSSQAGSHPESVACLCELSGSCPNWQMLCLVLLTPEWKCQNCLQGMGRVPHVANSHVVRAVPNGPCYVRLFLGLFPDQASMRRRLAELVGSLALPALSQVAGSVAMWASVSRGRKDNQRLWSSFPVRRIDKPRPKSCAARVRVSPGFHLCCLLC